MNLYEFDAVCISAGVLCGTDEAGRGPLAGPVFAAAVVLDPAHPVDGLNDSKKLSAARREKLYPLITERAVCWAIEAVSHDKIDRLNILEASMLAMRRAVEKLPVRPDLVLADGNRVPELSVPVRAVVGGDGKSAVIAAASILAKVGRDRFMLEMHELYPQYRFDLHKGYPTKLHYRMLDEHGPSPIHRSSFLRKWRESAR